YLGRPVAPEPTGRLADRLPRLRLQGVPMTFCPVRQAPNRCKHCGKEKACSDMRRTKNCLHGHQPGVCVACVIRMNDEYQVRDGVNYRRAHKLKEYGLTPDDYDKMFRDQDGACATCGLVSDRSLDVDHCHETGRVRGLLCNNCNRALGHAKDDPKVLRRMAEYLERR